MTGSEPDDSPRHGRTGRPLTSLRVRWRPLGGGRSVLGRSLGDAGSVLLQRLHARGWELRRLCGGTVLQAGEHLGDGAIELRIVGGEELTGIVLDLDIGFDAVVLQIGRASCRERV